MASTADFRNGLCLEFNDDIFQIVEFQHVKPGKGGAFVRTKLKSLTTGRVLENTFNAGVKINTVRIERRTYQYLYNDETGYHFMNNESFDQITLLPEMVESAQYLKEGQTVEMMVHADTEQILTCEIPQFVILQVTYTEPGLKGDTATNAQKKATLETGAEVSVPLFIDTGEIIKVDTREHSYVERVKK